MSENLTTAQLSPPSKKFSLEAYIAFEEISEVRHEFNNGKLTPMADTSDAHNEICGNLYILLRQFYKNSPCKVYSENVKVELSKNKRFTYPDVFVTCDERDVKEKYIKKYPVFICEVASKSTRIYDQTEKFKLYARIDSLQHYLLIDQEVCLVQHFYKTKENKWETNIFTKKEDKIKLESMNLEVSVEDIYAV